MKVVGIGGVRWTWHAFKTNLSSENVKAEKSQIMGVLPLLT